MMKKVGYVMLLLGLLGVILSLLFKGQELKWFVLYTLISLMVACLGLSFIIIQLKTTTRKKVKLIVLISVVTLIILGGASLFFGIIGARIELILGVMLYCFSYAPVQLYDKYKKWRPYSRTKTEVFFLVFGDFISINFIILGVLFKLQHWPFADKMITYGSLSLIILLLLWNSRLKKEIILRKEREDALKEKKQEILDSITYAKRLQDAILPPNKLVSAYLLESFIIYKPKDIVAGDFYFMDVVEDSDSNRNGKKRVYYVAADCTGHGVPGAMVSIVGANGLKRCIQEFGLRDPGKILDKLAQLVAENFSQSEEKIRDGMDLALCCLEIENSKTVRVHYAGANNPLWVINNNRQNIPASAIEFKEGGGFEIKANKQAIGYTENITSFTTHVFDVEEGDKLYTFSDGYPDQFGGKLGKKYKSANFRRFLLSIEDKDMDEQKKLVDEEFENWKGELEQVDDVCVIGVRL